MVRVDIKSLYLRVVPEHWPRRLPSALTGPIGHETVFPCPLRSSHSGRVPTKGIAVAILVMNFEVDDYDTWKAMFDEDPAGRRQSGATGHVLSRAVDNPNEGFVRVEFPSVEQAKAFRERLVASGALERGGMRLKMGPTVAEVDEAATY